MGAGDPADGFQSTHPVWGGTAVGEVLLSAGIDFNPPTPCGVGRIGVGVLGSVPVEFQSTHPVWGGTHPKHLSNASSEHFNPPTPCGVGLIYTRPGGYIYIISIHPPRVGWDLMGVAMIFGVDPFQSTHPVWGGTITRAIARLTSLFQSTHPVWGGTSVSKLDNIADQFQSTHPVWGGTETHIRRTDKVDISIHPPRVGWDGSRFRRPQEHCNFNPPTPCGVGQYCNPGQRHQHHFNPPTPCGVGPHRAP